MFDSMRHIQNRRVARNLRTIGDAGEALQQHRNGDLVVAGFIDQATGYTIEAPVTLVRS